MLDPWRMYWNITKTLFWLGSWNRKCKQQLSKATVSYYTSEETFCTFRKTLSLWNKTILKVDAGFCLKFTFVLLSKNYFSVAYSLESITLPIQLHTTTIRREFVSCSRFVFAFQSQMSRMMSDVRSLMAAERQHRQELEQAELEKRELMELLKGLQKDCRLTTTEGSRKPANFRPLTRLESVKRKPREVTVI